MPNEIGRRGFQPPWMHGAAAASQPQAAIGPATIRATRLVADLENAAELREVRAEYPGGDPEPVRRADGREQWRCLRLEHVIWAERRATVARPR